MGFQYIRRQKMGDRRWAFFGRDERGFEVLVALVGGGSTRRLEDLRAPLPVDIFAPKLLDVDELRRATRDPQTNEGTK